MCIFMLIVFMRFLLTHCCMHFIHCRIYISQDVNFSHIWYTLYILENLLYLYISYVVTLCNHYVIWGDPGVWYQKWYWSGSNASDAKNDINSLMHWIVQYYIDCNRPVQWYITTMLCIQDMDFKLFHTSLIPLLEPCFKINTFVVKWMTG